VDALRLRKVRSVLCLGMRLRRVTPRIIEHTVIVSLPSFTSRRELSRAIYEVDLVTPGESRGLS
jgi:hypothetical protein